MNLNKGNFRLESKPALVEVTSVAAQRRPARALVVLDLSGSMRLPGKLKVISSLAHGFIDASPANARFALATFSERIRDRLGFATTKEVFLQTLDSISKESPEVKGGRTALIDSVTEAVSLFGSPQSGDVVFLISDGFDNRSHGHLRELKNLLLRRGIRLFCFVPFEHFPDEEERIGPPALEKLAWSTGGRSFTLESTSFSRSWDNSEKALAREYEMGKYMYVLAASGYDLELKVGSPTQKAIPLKLKLVGSEGEPMRDVKVLYPQELMPCVSN